MKAPELNISAMNDFELKGILLSLIGNAKRNQLLSILEIFTENKSLDKLPYALTPEQEAELLISLEETYHEENMMSLEEAKNTHARWLKP
jgi:hypothetical protein